MEEESDLTVLSTTFPEITKPEILRDNLISYIRDQFSSDQKVIAVQGVVGSGKTTLLAQFARAFRDRSFSFFAGTTFPTSHPRVFHMDMCEQMAKALGRQIDNIEEYTTEKLETLYLDLFRHVGQLSKQNQTEYYYIVDGIEWLPSGSAGHSILDYLPGEPKGNIRVLLSSEVGRTFSFKTKASTIVFFSSKETEAYLDGLGLEAKDIQAIYKRCHGMPGYLAGLKRLLVSGVLFSELNEKLPYELKEIFDLEWNRIGDVNASFEKILSLFAYSSEALTLQQAVQILGFDQSEVDDYETKLRRTSFLRIEHKDASITFVSEAHRQFATNRLRHLRGETEQRLISYYSADPFSKPSLALLPNYLATHGKYDQLRELVTIDYVSRALQTSHDAGALRKTLGLAADQALAKNDLRSLLTYTLVSSVLTSLSKKPIATSEVQALIDLGDYAQAFAVAYESLLIEDKLQLSALIGSRMQQAKISVPEKIIIDLEQMAAAVDPLTLKRRSFEIAASLFDLLPEAAVGLVERAGIVGDSERSIDLARAMLGIFLDKDSDDIVRSRITDQSLRDFTTAHSPRISALAADEIIAEVSRISDTSAKIACLKSWCNEHQEDESSWRVVELALEVITGDQTYASSMRTLRQLAQSIMPEPSGRADKLVKRIDLLKATALKKPAEEVIWIELVLARLESKWDGDQGNSRMLEAYFNVESLPDLDVQCYALLRVVLMAPLIDPTDSLGLWKEAEDALKNKFKSLLDSSADHEEIAERLLGALAKKKHHLAVEFAQCLNRERRRDQALQKVLESYASSAAESIDLDFTEKTLAKIANKTLRNYTRVNILRVLSGTDLFQKVPKSRSFFRNSDGVDHPWNNCFGMAFSINAMQRSGDNGFVTAQYKNILAELDRIDSKWDQVSLGFALSSVLGKDVPRLGQELLKYAYQKRSESPLSEEFFAEIYEECLRLAIKLLTKFNGQKAFNWDNCNQVISLIRNIPSFSTQCGLLGNLALELLLSGFNTEFQKIVAQELLPTFENCLNAQSRRASLRYVAPALYEYEGQHFLGRISDLSPDDRDSILVRVLKYFLANCDPGEPVSFEKLKSNLDIRTARKILDIVCEISTDSWLTVTIELLVDSIIVRDPYDKHRERCKFIEREALEIAGRLHAIASTKLPDRNNIQHRGWLIIALANIERLKAAAQSRTPDRREWQSIVDDADGIPNVADRIFVYTAIAKQMAVCQSSFAELVLKKAEGVTGDIRNSIDRAERIYAVAHTWKELGRAEAVKDLLRNSLRALETGPLTKSRDEVMGEIMELAHSVDPDFASSLASVLENPVAEHRARLSWKAKTLQRSPQSMEYDTAQISEDLQDALGKAAEDMNAEYHAGTGTLPHSAVVAKWLRQMVNAKFEDTRKVVAWALENGLRQGKTVEEIGGLFQVLVGSLKLCMDMGTASMRGQNISASVSTVALPANLSLFKAGSKREAQGAVKDWLKATNHPYIKIYDPYFSCNDLEILKSVTTDTKVYIFTTWKAQKGINVGDRAVEQLFRDAWKDLSESNPPWTHIVVVGTKSGGSPIHSRFILAEGVGLNLGTSLSGLGAKETDIRELNPEEVAKIASEFVDPLLSHKLMMFNGEKLQIHPFLL